MEMKNGTITSGDGLAFGSSNVHYWLYASILINSYNKILLRHKKLQILIIAVTCTNVKIINAK